MGTSRIAALLTATAAVCATVMVIAAVPARAADQTYAMTGASVVNVVSNGNGHGHGMSQWGADGAAAKGLSAAQILAFYYPSTALHHLAAVPTIRVLISGGRADTCVQAKAGLRATGVAGQLPSAGIGSWQIVPSGHGLALQSSKSGGCAGPWSTFATQAAAKTLDISSLDGYVRLLRADGTATDYRGSIGAAREGNAEHTINRVNLDSYTEGVAPRESPASWPAAAVQAQAIAARTYALFGIEHAAPGSLYDICDTSACQVYGGMTHYNADHSVAWTDDPAALTGNSADVLLYHSQVVYAQYSASNGGWTVAGDQPYLVAKPDPYDTSAAGDPWVGHVQRVNVSHIAAAYGLRTVTQIEITARDGHGEFGGRVLAGYVDGRTVSGASARIATTGATLQTALGIADTWFSFETASGTPGIEGYVDTLVFPALLGRTVTGLNACTTKLFTGASPASVTHAIANSPEAEQRLVAGLFDSLVGRPLSPAGTKIWAARLRHDGYLRVVQQIVTMPEFYKHVGGTKAGFVRALFTNPDVLGRAKPPPNSAIASWVARLHAGMTRSAVVSLLLKSAEAVRHEVLAAAQVVLNRAPTSAGITSWARTDAKDGYNPETLKALMLSQGQPLQEFGIR